MAADPDHDFIIPDNDFFGLGPAEFAGEIYQQGLERAAGIKGLFPRPPPAAGQAPQVGLRKTSTRKPAPRLPCTFRRADTRADGSEWPAHIGPIQPWLICFVCGQQFSPASIAIHERQCLAKYSARARRTDPTPCRPRVIVQPPMSVSEYNQLAYQAFNDSANSRCPMCRKTFSNDRIEKHMASCNEMVEDEGGEEPTSGAIRRALDTGKTEAEAVAEAMRLWRLTHPKPTHRRSDQRGRWQQQQQEQQQERQQQHSTTPNGVNELLFCEWLDEMRGYTRCYHADGDEGSDDEMLDEDARESAGQECGGARRRQWQRRKERQSCRLEYIDYVSTVREHLQGQPVRTAIEARRGLVRGGVPGSDKGSHRQQTVKKRLRQIGQLKALRAAKQREQQQQQQQLQQQDEGIKHERGQQEDWQLSEQQLALLAREAELRRELRALTATRQPEVDWDLREALRPSGAQQPWRTETAPRCAVQGGTGVWAAQCYDPHEHGARHHARVLPASSSFSAVVRNTGNGESSSRRRSVSSSSSSFPSLDSKGTRLEIGGTSALSAAGSAPDSPHGAEDRGGEGGGAEKNCDDEGDGGEAGAGAAARGDQPVRVEDARLETKFPLRSEAIRRGQQCSDSGLGWDREQQAEGRAQGVLQLELGVAGLMIGPTRPLSRVRHLEAAFDTIDTRAHGGRLGVAGLQQLMANAGLNISSEAAQLMLEEAQAVGGGSQGLSLEEFVRMLKVA